MPTIFERRQNCPAPHSVPDRGVWIRGGAHEILGVVICSNGARQYKLRCVVCKTTGGPLPTKLLQAWGYDVGNVEWEQHNAPRVNYAPCSYSGCTVTPTEYHHFAPRNTFHGDADNWPVLPLCRPHHESWHRLMDGYRWHAKGAA